MNRLRLALKVLKDGEPAKEKEVITPVDATALSAALMREILGSIDVSKYRFERKLSENELKQYQQTVAAFFPTILEPTIKRLIAAQEQLAARGSQDLRMIGVTDPKDQILFARGTMNGLTLVLEEFQQAFNAHISEMTEKNEKFNPRELFPELFDVRKKHDD